MGYVQYTYTRIKDAKHAANPTAIARNASLPCLDCSSILAKVPPSVTSLKQTASNNDSRTYRTLGRSGKAVQEVNESKYLQTGQPSHTYLNKHIYLSTHLPIYIYIHMHIESMLL